VTNASNVMGIIPKNNALQCNERPIFKAGTHFILVTRQPF